MKIASRVSKTRDQSKTRLFNTRFWGFSYNDMDRVFHVDIKFTKLALQNRVLKTQFIFNVFFLFKKTPSKTEFQKHVFDHLKPKITLRNSTLSLSDTLPSQTHSLTLNFQNHSLSHPNQLPCSLSFHGLSSTLFMVFVLHLAC